MFNRGNYTYLKIYCSVERIQIKTAPSFPPPPLTQVKKKKRKKIKYVIYLGFFRNSKLLTADIKGVL